MLKKVFRTFRNRKLFSYSFAITGVSLALLVSVPLFIVLFHKPLFASTEGELSLSKLTDMGTAIRLSAAYLSIALCTGLAAIGAGVGTGIVGAAAVGVLAEKPDLFGRVLIFVGLAEGIAIYGLVMSIFILVKSG